MLCIYPIDFTLVHQHPLTPIRNGVRMSKLFDTNCQSATDWLQSRFPDDWLSTRKRRPDMRQNSSYIRYRRIRASDQLKGYLFSYTCRSLHKNLLFLFRNSFRKEMLRPWQITFLNFHFRGWKYARSTPHQLPFLFFGSRLFLHLPLNFVIFPIRCFLYFFCSLSFWRFLIDKSDAAWWLLAGCYHHVSKHWQLRSVVICLLHTFSDAPYTPVGSFNQEADEA